MKKIFSLLFIVTMIFAAIPDGYYDNASGLSGTALKTALHNIIDDHTEFSYSDLWTNLKYTDEDPNNSSNFILIYTGNSLSKTQAYPDWNREHSWPKSHGDFGDSPPAGTDMHHLRPSDVDVNGARGNKDYDNGGSLVSGTTDCYTDGDSFEPRDEVKGDCARMMFYMVARYEGDSGEPDLELVDYTGTSGPNLGKLSTLLAWHIADPVDDWERRRNDRVYGFQNNRNPFIDHPEYVSYIWGGETPSVLPAPQANAATDVDSTSFTANWTSVSNADAYKLYIAPNEFFTTFVSGYGPKTINGTSDNVANLIPETDYYYKVKAYNSSEESEFSNAIHTITLEGGGSVTPPDTGTHVETFANFPETGPFYNDGSFMGQNGSTWSYVQCRGDFVISDETPCLGIGTTPTASITSGTIIGGIGTLSFQYKQALTLNVSLDVFVNTEKVATVTSSGEMGIIKESGTINVDVPDNAVIKFIQSSSVSGQVAIDNVSWTSYPVSIDPEIPSNFQVGDAYPNPFNPSCTLPLELAYDEYVKVSLFDILGKERQNVYEGTMMRGSHELNVDGSSLPTGVYLLQILHSNEILTQKVVLLK
jgi:endonuclease I